MKKISLNITILVSMFFSTFNCFGQYNETLRSDRPGKTMSPFIPGKNVFQLESGFLFGKFKVKNRSGSENNVLLNTNEFRWGLLKNFEFNTTFEFQKERVYLNDTLADVNSGLSNLTVGTRYLIFNEKREKFVPVVSLQLSVLLNLLSDSFNPKEAAPSFTLIIHQQFNDQISFVSNIGMGWNGNNEQPTGNYALNLNADVTQKLGFMVENYGTFTNNNPDTYFDVGIYYFLSNNFKVDLSTGFGANDGFQNYFFMTGFSWRFKKGYYYYQEFVD